MSDWREPPGSPETGRAGSPVSFGAFWAGLVVFGIIDFPLALWGFGKTDATLPAVVLAVGAVVLAAILWVRARSVSLGIVAGYVLMTIVSGGMCTLTFGDPLNEGSGALFGLVLYPAAVILSGAIGMIIYYVRRRRAA